MRCLVVADVGAEVVVADDEVVGGVVVGDGELVGDGVVVSGDCDVGGVVVTEDGVVTAGGTGWLGRCDRTVMKMKNTISRARMARTTRTGRSQRRRTGARSMRSSTCEAVTR